MQQPAPKTATADGPLATELTDEKVKQMQLMVKQAMSILLEDTSAEMIVNRCKQEDASMVLAETVNGIMGDIWSTAQEAGTDVDMVTVMVAGMQVIGTLSELLVVEGIVPKEKAPEFVAGTCKLAVEMHNATIKQMAQQGGEAPAPDAPQPAQAAPAGGGMIAQGAQA
jgi:hypothetical protein